MHARRSAPCRSFKSTPTPGQRSIFCSTRPSTSPPRHVAAWIEKLAPEFAALKPRLRALLLRAAQIETDDALNTLPKLELEPGDLAQAPGREDQPGDEIGLYRLLRELGSGGMGVVWLAERTDGLINRPVALKLPHGAWKRAGLAERMAREREILASLAHPNIAHLYDAGITADGQPYLAIEYVEGCASTCTAGSGISMCAPGSGCSCKSPTRWHTPTANSSYIAI